MTTHEKIVDLLNCMEAEMSNALFCGKRSDYVCYLKEGKENAMKIDQILILYRVAMKSIL